MFRKSTFGTYKCSENLIRILNEADNAKFNRKTGRYISEHFELIKTVADITNPKHRRALAGLVRKNVKEIAVDVPEIIKTHIQNVVLTKLKDSMKQSEYY